jgi:hypothetical protein
VIGDDDGQAAIEFVGILPLIVTVGLLVAQLLAAGAAHEAAGDAAQAAAMALIQGGDPERAAREAIPGWSRGRVTIEVDGRTVHVRVAPRVVLPGGGHLLASEGVADAGPAR